MIEVGDRVKITEFYAAIYPAWYNEVKDKIATVKKSVQGFVKASSLDKESKALYISRYGVRDEYEYYNLEVSFDGHRDRYVVSQLGFTPSEE